MFGEPEHGYTQKEYEMMYERELEKNVKLRLQVTDLTNQILGFAETKNKELDAGVEIFRLKKENKTLKKALQLAVNQNETLIRKDTLPGGGFIHTSCQH